MDPYLQVALEGKPEATKYSYSVTFDKCLAATTSADARALLLGPTIS
jgi:hypothetical protein